MEMSCEQAAKRSYKFAGRLKSSVFLVLSDTIIESRLVILRLFNNNIKINYEEVRLIKTSGRFFTHKNEEHYQ